MIVWTLAKERFPRRGKQNPVTSAQSILPTHHSGGKNEDPQVGIQTDGHPVTELRIMLRSSTYGVRFDSDPPRHYLCGSFLQPLQELTRLLLRAPSNILEESAPAVGTVTVDRAENQVHKVMKREDRGAMG